MSDWPAQDEQIQLVLNRVLASGSLLRVPKHPVHRQIVMALLSLHLERRYPYSELELKDTLIEALKMFRSSIDHVTCRRYLVDLGFMKRDRAGTRYYLNFLKLAETLPSTLTLERVTEMARAAMERRARQAKNDSRTKR